jgi:hypothetical protein
VGERARAEEVQQLGRALDQVLHRRILGVEDPQRVEVEAAPRVIVEHRSVGLEVGDERGAVRTPLLGLAQAVQLQADIAVFDEPEVAPQRPAHQDQFGIDIRSGEAEGLGPDLVKLPIAPLLRPLVTEHRPM